MYMSLRQHPRDYELSNSEVLQDIVSYSPQLAGCSPHAQPQAVSESVKSYVDKVLNRHKDHMTTEQLCVWLSSQVGCLLSPK